MCVVGCVKTVVVGGEWCVCVCVCVKTVALGMCVCVVVGVCVSEDGGSGGRG